MATDTSRRLAGADHRRRKLQTRRPVLDDAIALLADKYGIEAHVGYSVHNRRLYAGGVPLMDPDGAPVAVFDPNRAELRGEAFLLLAGLLLLFQANTARDQFLTKMSKTKYRPVEGYRTGVCATEPEDTQST